MKGISVPFFRLSSVESEIQEVEKVLRSGWLTTAEKAEEFQNKFAQYLGVKHALAVNSGTAALHLALEASGVRAGNRVIVPVHTFTATAEVVRYLQAEVEFVDVDRETFCIDVQEIAKKIQADSFLRQGSDSSDTESQRRSGRIKAIVPVHFGGHPCDMDHIMDLAHAYKLKTIEDSAHALPTFYQSRKDSFLPSIVGTIGDITCFSFYANKTITTGEGGMLVTNDDDTAKRVRIMRLHGIDRDIWRRYQSTRPNWYYEVIAPGFKYNMPDIAAAIGIKQLEKCNYFHQRRLQIARYYFSTLSNIDGLRLPIPKCSFSHHSWHLFVILVDPPDDNGKISRDQFIHNLAALGVSTSVHYVPLHLHPYYRERYSLTPDQFPNSTWLAKRSVSIPIFPDMSDVEVDHVVRSIKKVLQ
jgi:dTDP-4-amino-4,6-dideoxygalactose transaminase